MKSDVEHTSAAEDLKQSVRPKLSQRGLMSRSKAAVRDVLPPRKSLRLHGETLTLPPELQGVGNYDHDIDSSEAELAQMTMGIYTVQSASPGNGCFAGVVLEGVTVIPNLRSVTMGCVMLFGLIYSFNLSYPKDLGPSAPAGCTPGHNATSNVELKVTTNFNLRLVHQLDLSPLSVAPGCTFYA